MITIYAPQFQNRFTILKSAPILTKDLFFTMGSCTSGSARSGSARSGKLTIVPFAGFQNSYSVIRLTAKSFQNHFKITHWVYGTQFQNSYSVKTTLKKAFQNSFKAINFLDPENIKITFKNNFRVIKLSRFSAHFQNKYIIKRGMGNVQFQNSFRIFPVDDSAVIKISFQNSFRVNRLIGNVQFQNSFRVNKLIGNAQFQNSFSVLSGILVDTQGYKNDTSNMGWL